MRISVDKHFLMDLAKKLISIPSPTESESDVMKFLEQLFVSEGFETQIQEVEPGRPQVIATLKGTGGGRSLMFNGHLDNDSVNNRWIDIGKDPYTPEIDGNILWGAGIHNMKSGVAAMIAAAISIKRAAIPLKGDLVIACVVGELQGGKGTLFMLESGVRTDMAIVPEPYSVSNIVTKCVGVHKCAITTIGRSIHTSRSHLAVNAVKKMDYVRLGLGEIDLPILNPDDVIKLEIPGDDPSFPDVPKINVASVIGGRGREYDLAGPSNTPDVCTIIVDVRYSGHWEPQDIDERFVDFLERLRARDPDFNYEYHHPPPPRFGVGGADMPPTNVEPDMEIVNIVERNHLKISGQQIQKKGIILPYSYCGNDTAHLERAGIPCCLYGPRGYDEDVELHVRIDEMETCADVLAQCALDVCG